MELLHNFGFWYLLLVVLIGYRYFTGLQHSSNFQYIDYESLFNPKKKRVGISFLVFHMACASVIFCINDVAKYNYFPVLSEKNLTALIMLFLWVFSWVFAPIVFGQKLKRTTKRILLLISSTTAVVGLILIFARVFSIESLASIIGYTYFAMISISFLLVVSILSLDRPFENYSGT